MNVHASIERSQSAATALRAPVFRSSRLSTHLSASKPARACDRHDRYCPSGEYCGPPSAPGAVVICFGCAFGVVRSTMKMSLLVLMASTLSVFFANAISFESGEKA